MREALLRIPGVLRTFRRSFLAAGRLNFPDSPLPKDYYLAWGRRLPTLSQRLNGAVALARMLLRLRRQIPYRLAELLDNDVGEPSGVRLGSRRLTEVKVRSFYYGSRITTALGGEFGAVLEVGGGFGALAGELLTHASIGRYCIVELPDAVPLATFYLRACFDCPVQALWEEGAAIDSSARIVVLAPWMLRTVHHAVDLALNTMSFQHMERRNLEFYFREIDRLAAAHLFLVNRNTKRDPTDLAIDDYPIPAGYRLIGDQPFLFGAHRERLYRRQ